MYLLPTSLFAVVKDKMRMWIVIHILMCSVQAGTLDIRMFYQPFLLCIEPTDSNESMIYTRTDSPHEAYIENFYGVIAWQQGSETVLKKAFNAKPFYYLRYTGQENEMLHIEWSNNLKIGSCPDTVVADIAHMDVNDFNFLMMALGIFSFGSFLLLVTNIIFRRDK